MTLQQYDEIQLHVYSGKYNSQISTISANSYKFYLNFHRQIVFTK